MAKSQGGDVQVSNLLANKSQEVATISQERTVNDALMLLKERSIGALVVTGLDAAAIGDVVKARFDELEHEKKDLLDYVSAR